MKTKFAGKIWRKKGKRVSKNLNVSLHGGRRFKNRQNRPYVSNERCLSKLNRASMSELNNCLFFFFFFSYDFSWNIVYQFFDSIIIQWTLYAIQDILEYVNYTLKFQNFVYIFCRKLGSWTSLSLGNFELISNRKLVRKDPVGSTFSLCLFAVWDKSVVGPWLQDFNWGQCLMSVFCSGPSWCIELLE